MTLVELASGTTLEEVRNKTEAAYHTSNTL
jgi:acyl CoA:acetate/3-ketoacid CoA transferase beta subunit